MTITLQLPADRITLAHLLMQGMVSPDRLGELLLDAHMDVGLFNETMGAIRELAGHPPELLRTYFVKVLTEMAKAVITPAHDAIHLRPIETLVPAAKRAKERKCQQH